VKAETIPPEGNRITGGPPLVLTSPWIEGQATPSVVEVVLGEESGPPVVVVVVVPEVVEVDKLIAEVAEVVDVVDVEVVVVVDVEPVFELGFVEVLDFVRELSWLMTASSCSTSDWY
jgi:hypothetical protein